MQTYLPNNNLYLFTILDNLIELGKKLGKNIENYQNIFFENQLDFMNFSQDEILPFRGLLEWRYAEWLQKKGDLEKA